MKTEALRAGLFLHSPRSASNTEAGGQAEAGTSHHQLSHGRSRDERAGRASVAYPIGGVFPSAHGLQHSFIQTELQTSLVEHLPFVRISRDQPVDFHRFALSYSVTSSLGLQEEENEWPPEKEILNCQPQEHLF